MAGERQVQAAALTGVDKQPVDLAERQAGILDREPDRFGGQRAGAAPVHLAHVSQARADDHRGAIHCRPPSSRSWPATATLAGVAGFQLALVT